MAVADRRPQDWTTRTLNFNHSSPWTVVQPTVFRFMDTNYVDSFFEDGSLRLSSFAQFSKHKDEARKDPNEGKAIANLSDGQKSVFVVSRFGTSCYVLCGSISSSEEVSGSFGPSAIVIEQATEFAGIVARALPNYRFGVEGLCRYQDEAVLARNVEEGSVDALLEENRLPDGNLNMDLIRQLATVTSLDQLFLKNTKYAYQLEYRLIWECSTVSDVIDIKVPDARQFCKRFDR